MWIDYKLSCQRAVEAFQDQWQTLKNDLRFLITLAMHITSLHNLITLNKWPWALLLQFVFFGKNWNFEFMASNLHMMNRRVELFVSYRFSVQQETTASQLSRKVKRILKKLEFFTQK